jgi:adenosylcobinamide-GDP ribazoletransferase
MEEANSVLRLIKQILWLIQFLTTIPLKLTISMEPEDFGRSLAYAPLIGLLLGGILAASFYILRFLFPIMISSLFLCIIYVFLTGGLHLDGLGDTADGLFSHRPKERILEIMKDSRVGTNAVLAVIFVILSYIFLIMQIPTKALGLIVLMPVIGRMALPLAAGLEKYARQNGLGLHFINFCGPKEIIIGLTITSAISFLILGIKGLLIVLSIGILISFITKLLAAKIDGITGDILGAVCELAQLFYLVLIYLIYLRPQTLL